jgi:hypothetical protein
MLTAFSIDTSSVISTAAGTILEFEFRTGCRDQAWIRPTREFSARSAKSASPIPPVAPTITISELSGSEAISELIVVSLGDEVTLGSYGAGTEADDNSCSELFAQIGIPSWCELLPDSPHIKAKKKQKGGSEHD